MQTNFGFIAYHVINNVNIDAIPKFSVFNTSRFGRLDVDWLVENMTPEATLYRMSLHVSV